MDPRTDAELVVAARGGDRVATEQLLARHAPALLRFTTRRCSDPVDAEDVVQEALVSAEDRKFERHSGRYTPVGYTHPEWRGKPSGREKRRDRGQKEGFSWSSAPGPAHAPA